MDAHQIPPRAPRPTAAQGAGIPVKSEIVKARDAAIEHALRAANGEGLSFTELLVKLPAEAWLGEEHQRRALSDVLTRCRLKKRAAPGADQRWRWQAA